MVHIPPQTRIENEEMLIDLGVRVQSMDVVTQHYLLKAIDEVTILDFATKNPIAHSAGCAVSKLIAQKSNDYAMAEVVSSKTMRKLILARQAAWVRSNAKQKDEQFYQTIKAYVELIFLAQMETLFGLSAKLPHKLDTMA